MSWRTRVTCDKPNLKNQQTEFTIVHWAQKMNYSEIIVDNVQLKNDILCYWQMNGSIPLSDSLSSRYIPKGQSLLIFNYGNEIKLPNQKINSSFFVVPAVNSSLIINQTGKINLVGISFIGDGLYKLLNQPITEPDQPIPKKLNKACQKLYRALEESNFKNKSGKIELFLLENLNRELINTTFNKALQLINESKGILKINQLSEQLNISGRHLQRLFKTRLGLTPKDFCKITRVNNYINFILESPKSIDWMDLVVEFKYYDQSHFINEVKTISKLSPQKLLKYRDTLIHLYNLD